MRRNLTACTLAAALVASPLLASVARAEDETKTSSDSSSSSSTSSSSTESSSGGGFTGGGLHDTGGLFDSADQSRKHMISLMAIIPEWYDGVFGVGGGLRYSLPIIANGFIPKLNDEFGLEFGADLYLAPNYLSDSVVGIAGAVGARYAFHLTPKIETYARVSFGIQWRNYTSGIGNSRWQGFNLFYWDAGLGANWHFTDMWALRAEVSYSGFRIGIGFAF